MARGQVVVKWNGPKVKANARTGAIAGLKSASEHLLGQARQETPLQEGHLERSGRPHLYPSTLMAAVSFNTPYARIQHESPHFRHPIRGKAYYLRDPFRRERKTMLAIIATAIRRQNR